MSPESILLAILNALRPTGVAAVYALLSTPRPRRLLVAYISVGFAWSFAVGMVVVVALHGVKVETRILDGKFGGEPGFGGRRRRVRSGHRHRED